MKTFLDYNRRLRRLRRKLSEAGADALLVSDGVDISYLTGTYFENNLLLLFGSGRTLYLADGMNRDLVMHRMSALDVDVKGGAIYGELVRVLQNDGVRKLFLSLDNITAGVFNRLRGDLKRTTMMDAPGFISGMRMIKDEDEVNVIRRAARKTMDVWRRVKRVVSPGITEKALAGIVDVEIRKVSDGNSFPTIAAAGPMSAFPHAIPGDKVVMPGEHVLFDFGIRLEGYCSDLTRIWAKGRINRKIREAREAVYRVNRDIINRLKPGIRIGTLEKLAHKYFSDNALDKYMCHGLGHGVGLNVHERPFFRINSGLSLKKGMVITVEPGLYIPGVGGIRKEDMVLVNSKGCEVLTV